MKLLECLCNRRRDVFDSMFLLRVCDVIVSIAFGHSPLEHVDFRHFPGGVGLNHLLPVFDHLVDDVLALLEDPCLDFGLVVVGFVRVESLPLGSLLQTQRLLPRAHN